MQRELETAVLRNRPGDAGREVEQDRSSGWGLVDVDRRSCRSGQRGGGEDCHGELDELHVDLLVVVSLLLSMWMWLSMQISELMLMVDPTGVCGQARHTYTHQELKTTRHRLTLNNHVHSPVSGECFLVVGVHSIQDHLLGRRSSIISLAPVDFEQPYSLTGLWTVSVLDSET